MKKIGLLGVFIFAIVLSAFCQAASNKIIGKWQLSELEEFGKNML